MVKRSERLSAAKQTTVLNGGGVIVVCGSRAKIQAVETRLNAVEAGIHTIEAGIHATEAGIHAIEACLDSTQAHFHTTKPTVDRVQSVKNMICVLNGGEIDHALHLVHEVVETGPNAIEIRLRSRLLTLRIHAGGLCACREVRK
jgi:2-keto-3-deoxy-6-phosphogluconate aldolase